QIQNEIQEIIKALQDYILLIHSSAVRIEQHDLRTLKSCQLQALYYGLSSCVVTNQHDLALNYYQEIATLIELKKGLNNPYKIFNLLKEEFSYNPTMIFFF
ncbi:MAG: hypothetical protein OMM_13522, partial [Candidatus Magnetoglobus multicellularis str. Araruama]